MKLLIDESGTAIRKPVVEWLITAIGELGVLLSVEYFDNPTEHSLNQTRQIQLGFQTQHALEVADQLQKLARSIQAAARHPKPVN